jgi:ketosteroid isomerase-like protein
VNVVERFAEAFNRRDVDGLLDCFTEDATYRDLFYGPHAGRAVLRGMFERMFREGRDYRWQMDAIVVDAHRAAAEWTFSYTATAAVPRGMSIFDLEGARARAYREYADTGVALLQLGFAPESLAKVLARRVPTA